MNTATRVFLVLLRLAIGWHFLFEGLDKVHTHRLGDIPGNKPWTSEGYFREASGPLGPVFRSMIGDPDERALALLTLRDGDKPADRVPKALRDDWDAFRQRLVASYKLSQKEADLLAEKQKQQEDAVVAWLTTHKRDYVRTYPSGSVDETVTVPELIAEYRAKVQEVRHTIDEKLYAFGQDVEGPKLRALKAEVAKLRTELLAGPAARPGTANPIDSLGEYDQEYRRVILEAIPQTAVPGRLDRLAQAAERFRDAARAVDADKPTPQQVEQLKGLLVGVEEAVKTLNDAIQNLPEGEPKADVGPLLKTLSELGPVLPEASAASVNAGSGSAGTLFATLKSQVADLQKAYRHLSDLRSVLEQDEKTRGTLAAPGASPMLRFIDFTTRWGLVVVGWLLLIGLFSRPACVAGAAFLTMIYLSTPAFPWLPTPPNVEGHYLFVNKNVVELLALLALATTASGRWFGLDALLAWMSGRLRPATPRPIEAPPAPALPKKG